jgi:hypothetical protein
MYKLTQWSDCIQFLNTVGPSYKAPLAKDCISYQVRLQMHWEIISIPIFNLKRGHLSYKDTFSLQKWDSCININLPPPPPLLLTPTKKSSILRLYLILFHHHHAQYITYFIHIYITSVDILFIYLSCPSLQLCVNCYRMT